MFQSRLGMFLVALLSSVLLARVNAAPYREPLKELLRADLDKDEDLSRLLLLKYLSELAAAGDNEVLPELVEESGLREEVARRHLPLSHRDRKAGCRNFFWKTFTSC